MNANLIRKLVSKALFVIAAIVGPLVSLIGLLFPKDDLVIFSGSSGKRIADNSLYLYRYFEHSGDIRSYWYTRETQLPDLRGIDPGKILTGFSLANLGIFFRARCVFISHGMGDFMPYNFLCRGTPVVNVWHGIPLKRIGSLDKQESKNKVLHAIRAWFYIKYDYFVASSDREIPIYSTAFHLDPGKIWVTGMPRNDPLIEARSRYASRSENNKPGQVQVEAEYRILYAPTFRDDGRPVRYFPFPDYDLTQIVDFLRRRNARIIIRAHVNEARIHGLPREIQDGSDNVISFLGQDVCPDINDSLADMDMLLTDYSSIFFDYLLLDRPMIFLPYDLDEYVGIRGGFLFDYKDTIPGQAVETQADFLHLVEAYIDNPALDQEKRGKMLAAFHAYSSGSACKRIFDKVSSLP